MAADPPPDDDDGGDTGGWYMPDCDPDTDDHPLLPPFPLDPFVVLLPLLPLSLGSSLTPLLDPLLALVDPEQSP